MGSDVWRKTVFVYCADSTNFPARIICLCLATAAAEAFSLMLISFFTIFSCSALRKYFHKFPCFLYTSFLT
jgi:hypothetical protein